MKTEEIKAIIEEIEEEREWGIIGIRTQEQPFELGKIDHCSKVWIDGEETDEELDGISCSLKYYADMHAEDYNIRRGFYFGDHTAIIGGSRFTYGEDSGEIIISDPVVIRIIK